MKTSPEGRFQVVSGVARSGTSAMMLCLKEAGVQIGGFKYPITTIDAQGKHCDAGVARAYHSSQLQMNPRGYWEYPSIVKAGVQEYHKDYDGEVIKILLQGLIKSDVNCISKIIVMVRNYRKVLGSLIKKGELKEDDKEKLQIHALSMVHNTVFSLKWMAQMCREFKVVIYEELLVDPMGVMKDTCEWLGKGNADWCTDSIDKGLDRSKPVDLNTSVMEFIDKFYDLCVIRDLDGIYAMECKNIKKMSDELYIESQKKHNTQKQPQKES